MLGPQEALGSGQGFEIQTGAQASCLPCGPRWDWEETLTKDRWAGIFAVVITHDTWGKT